MEKREKTFTYVYTAHPDKHMHELGVEHESIRYIVRAFDKTVERMWTSLEELARGQDKVSDFASLFLTADHGHVTVDFAKGEFVCIPPAIADRFLDYACVGATGKGRHAYLHVKPGLKRKFEKAWYRWAAESGHIENFALLEIEAAEALALFGESRFPEDEEECFAGAQSDAQSSVGPGGPSKAFREDETEESRTGAVYGGTNTKGAMAEASRSRVGDYVVIALNHATLCDPAEFEKFRGRAAESGGRAVCGAHGSCTREEMEIPHVVLKTTAGAKTTLS